MFNFVWKGLVLGVSAIVILVLIASLGSQTPNLDDFVAMENCLGPPYIYVSCHGFNSRNNNRGTWQILRYSRDFCPLGEVLGDEVRVDELRSMLIVHDGLYVTSGVYPSKISRFGLCNWSIAQGVRPYIDDFVTQDTNPGIHHPYGLAMDKHNNIFISNQHSDCVLGFDPSGNPLPTPKALNNSQNEIPRYPGTFIQYKLGETTQGVRAIAFDFHDTFHQHLWVANEDLGKVLIYDFDGFEVNYVDIANPIGLYLDKGRNAMYIGSKSITDPKIIVVDTKSLEILGTYRHPLLTHPTGLAVHAKILYVAAQRPTGNNGWLFSFNTTSKDFVDQNVIDIDNPEQLILAPC